jgi:nicotinamidase-related amidase
MKRALVIVDIQNDYFPGGAMELVGSEDAAKRAGALLGAFRRAGGPIVHVQHVAGPGATFFRPGTPGVEIHESVRPAAGETVIEKHHPSAFRETDLLERLRGLGADELVIAGMMTHMCIDTTTRAAADLGFTCLLAHDACATKALSYGGVTVPAQQVQLAYLAALHGTFANVLRAEDVHAAA